MMSNTLGSARQGGRWWWSTTGRMAVLSVAVRTFRGCSLWRRGLFATLGRTVCDPATEANLSYALVRRSALWARWSTMAQDRLLPRRNPDLAPWGRDLKMLQIGRSPGTSQTT
jgi:hypothetical protein